ncbi:MAG TPA: phage portal protein [Ignavibacteriales bacterium]|nr:phage portal protein [Ignavibacteriales bacterium]
MTSQQIVQLLNSYQNKLNSKIIKDIIQDNLETKKRVSALYNTYKGDALIKSRTFEDTTKVNNKLPQDYPGDIVDQVVGYLWGVPIAYSINEENYSEGELVKAKEALKSFLTRNDIEELDSTTGEFMSACSFGARLCYIDKDGKERVMNIKPWECAFIMDPTLDEVQFGFIYYDIDLIENGKSVKRTKVEWYDNQNVSFFITDDKGDFTPDPTQPEPKAHLFDYVPLVIYPNNNIMKSDFEKVQEDIDAMDRLLSDIQNEAEEFRLAYMVFENATVDKETVQAARRSGAFSLPENGKASFLTKDINAEFLENHKKTLNENIYKFSKSVDMNDENFSGAAQTGESRKWKLVGLETKAKTKERKFTKATRTMFKIICSAWAKKQIKLNYEDIEMQYTRNLPVDLDYSATVTGKLKGMVSEKTRLSLLPFVPDPEAELQQMQDEEASNPNINWETVPPKPKNSGDGANG